MKSTSITPSVALFFGVTFALSWIIWIPLAVSHLGTAPFVAEGASNGIRLLGVLGPAIVAILLTAFLGGGKAVGQLLGRLKLWKVGWSWWAAVALVQPLLLVAVALAYNGLGGNPPFTFGGQFTAVEFAVQVIFLAIATLGEEIGWRGVALPALLKKNSALVASLVLGTIWTAWHVPFWLLQDSFDTFGPGYMLLNLLMILPMSVYITWVFNHTRGSLLMPAVLHLTFNIVNVAIVPLTGQITPFVVFIALQWLIAGLLVWRFGAKTLARV